MSKVDVDNTELHNAELTCNAKVSTVRCTRPTGHDGACVAGAFPSLVQTPGTSTPDTDDLVNVLVQTIDALQAGQTLRSLARTPGKVHVPPSIRPLLDRIGTQLASAATVKLAAKRAKRAP